MELNNFNTFNQKNILVKMGRTKANLLEVGTKDQSKNELYRLLIVEGGMYLPPQEKNMKFISDIAFGKKSVRWIYRRFSYQMNLGSLFSRCKGVTSSSRWFTQSKGFDLVHHWGLPGRNLFTKELLRVNTKSGWLANICSFILSLILFRQHFELWKVSVNDSRFLESQRRQTSQEETYGNWYWSKVCIHSEKFINGIKYVIYSTHSLQSQKRSLTISSEISYLEMRKSRRIELKRRKMMRSRQLMISKKMLTISTKN